MQHSCLDLDPGANLSAKKRHATRLLPHLSQSGRVLASLSLLMALWLGLLAPAVSPVAAAAPAAGF